MGKMNIKSLFRRRLKLRSKSSVGSTGGSSGGSGSGASDPSSATSPTTTSGELERVFSKFDSNGDGKISAEELAAIFATLGDGEPLTDEELRRMMAEADSDGDGFISLDEFVDLNTLRVDPTAALEDLRHAFSMFDLDRNGSISAEELARVLRSLGEGGVGRAVQEDDRRGRQGRGRHGQLRGVQGHDGRIWIRRDHEARRRQRRPLIEISSDLVEEEEKIMVICTDPRMMIMMRSIMEFDNSIIL
ncbi:polcalcin Jun o 2 isoform X1 [Iris pallida]|uniref:Polcalcin Jun o 2 isoform X1 n=1 Tax=Iris pallida TaxID=29817 RepID=A0AAX6FQH2_IRIPA|nr:polcalcin Jun o 2 isoform X1 [Iris pallida]